MCTTFRTRPDLRPPIVEVVHPAQATADGYLFITPLSGPGQRGVQMLDDRGNVVWFRPVPFGIAALNFRAATYKGEPVLTWWEGKALQGLGAGHCVIVDQSYREIARFKAGHNQPADLHEFLITPHDTALVTSNEVRTMDLTSVGGPSSWPVVGSVIQELEIPSARVLFEWHSLDHVALDESHQTIGAQFDYFHANSVDVDGQGNLLISARNTWAVYKVSRKTGEVIWRLGGKKSDFAMGPGTVFAWQHDARYHEHGQADQPLRRRRRPEGRAAVARTRDRARHQAHAHEPDAQVHPPPRAARDTHRQRAAPAERQHARRLGQRAVLHRVRPERRRPLRRAAAERRADVPCAPLPLGRPAASAAGARHPPVPVRPRRLRELERRDRGGLVAAPHGRGCRLRCRRV